MTVPYTFASATSAIPLSQLDSNFATPITLGNTAIQLGNTVTTLNNMSFPNVTITSGTINGVTINAATLTNAVSLNVGSTSYTPANAILTGGGNVNATVQMVLQNSSNLSNASSDYVVSVYGSTDTSLYGDFGMNGPSYSGTGSLGLANATYVYANGGDMVIGTATANSVRIVTNAGTTDAITVDSSNNVLLNKAGRATITTDNDLSFDMNAASNFQCTPSGTGALTFTNITSGQSGYVLLINSGGYAITAAASTKVGSSFLTTVSATGTYLISYFSTGSAVYCTTSGALS